MERSNAWMRLPELKSDNHGRAIEVHLPAREFKVIMTILARLYERLRTSVKPSKK